MKIKTKTKIYAILTIIIVLIISYILVTTSLKVIKANEDNKLIYTIAKDISDLNVLTYEYLLNHEERPKTQWKLKYNSLSELLKSQEFEKPKEQAIFNDILRSFKDIDPIFSQLIANYESQNESKELGERLSNQVLVKTHSMISDGHQIEELIGTDRAAAEQRAAFLLAFFVVILVIIKLTNNFLFSMRVANSIENLTHGIDKISKGEFDVEIDPKLSKLNDELGDLARSFNRTIVSLKLAIKRTSPELKKQIQEIGEREEVKTKAFRKSFYDEKEKN